jgi:hypothetical protein
LADLTKFNHVEPSLARFILAHEALGHSQGIGQLYLGETLPDAEFP